MKWLVTFVVVCLLSTAAHAQTVLTYDFGRNFSVADGLFMPSHVVGVEETRGPVTVGGALYVGTSGVFEKDVTVSVSKERGKWTFGLYGGTYWYTGIGRDWSWSVSVRRVIRGS